MKLLRLLTFLVVLVVSALLLVPHAAAQGNPTSVNVPAETAAVRDLLQQAMRAYRVGDYEAAYKLSRAAYLDHFENIEIPLRVLDADLTLDMEYRFADLRTKMQAAATAGGVEQSIRSVRDGLNEIDAMFSDVGALAPALAFGASFTIIFREGLEAVLIIAALLGYLRSGMQKGRRHVFLGIGLALVATVITWVLLRFIVQVAPVGRELLEAIISFVAVGMMFWVSFWLVNRLDRQRWMEFLHARAWAAMASGNALGLMGLGFTAVYREGFETALFYEVLLNLSNRAEWFVLYGFLAGLIALGVVAWLILRAGQRLPIRTFMRIAVAIVMLLSVAFIGKAVQELQESGLINATSLIGVVPRLPRPVAEFTGIHPTVETLLAQILLLGVYIAGGVALWWKSNRHPARAPLHGAR
ncbi:MAG: FTR1 family iron permease [Ardenticatenaceae bacterium]|nr:FTR1 family iron permease [Ardenticatenaceae bacterium]